MQDDLLKFRKALLEQGLQYNPDRTKYLFNVAKHCAKISGIPLAGAGAVMGAGAGSVTIPVIGSIPGYLAGALAGFISGTAMCTMSKAGLKKSLDALIMDYEKGQ